MFVASSASPARRAPGSAGCSTTSRPPSRGASGKPLTTLNVALTAAGLRGARRARTRSSATFATRVPRRAWRRARRLLGDIGAERPRQVGAAAWAPATRTCSLTINAQQTEDRRRALGKMRAAMTAAGGVAVVVQQDAELLAGAREHFGFADGFAQPAIEGASDEKARGGGVPGSDGRLARARARRVRARLPRRGHARRRAAPPAAGAGRRRSARSGTYMVWRKLYQDVALWRRTIARRRRALPGRRRGQAGGEGRRPLAQRHAARRRTPTAPDREFDAARAGRQRLSLRATTSTACAARSARTSAAPTRATRSASTGTLSFRHRMIRRGMPYGAPLPEGVHEDDGADRGLVFVCFQASISRQFEGVQVPVAQRRQHLRPRPRQGLPARRRERRRAR